MSPEPSEASKAGNKKKNNTKKTVKAQRRGWGLGRGGGVKTADGKEDDRGLGGLKVENKAKHVERREGGKKMSREIQSE